MQHKAETKVRYQFRGYLLNKLETHLKVRKGSLHAEAETFSKDYYNKSLDENPIFHLPSLKERLGGNKFFYAVHMSNFVIEEMMNPKHFAKSVLVQDYETGLGYLSPEQQAGYIMMIHLNGAKTPSHFVMYKAFAYNGFGGIFVKLPGARDGYVIELLSNWIANYTPEVED